MGVAALQRGAHAGFHVFLISESRIAQVGVQVDEGRQEGEAIQLQLLVEGLFHGADGEDLAIPKIEIAAAFAVRIHQERPA